MAKLQTKCLHTMPWFLLVAERTHCLSLSWLAGENMLFFPFVLVKDDISERQ